MTSVDSSNIDRLSDRQDHIMTATTNATIGLRSRDGGRSRT